MRKLSYFLIGVLIAVVFAPIAFGKTTNPVYIKEANVYTKTLNQGMAGEVTVCSSYHGQIKFEISVKNLTVIAQYKRNLTLLTSGCESYKLNFTPAFSNISKQGDKIVVDLRKIETEEADTPKKVDPYTTYIQDVDKDVLPCGDKIGTDDTYDACVGDFLTHRGTGVRMKVTSFNNEKITLVVTGIQWGGSLDLTIYKDKFKKIVAGNDDLTRLTLTYKGKGEKGDALLLIESL